MSALWRFSGGKRLNGHKSLSSEVPITSTPLPQTVVLPLLQHIGEPTEAIVKVGDKVRKGQIIASCRAYDCAFYVSAPIHASISGTVVAIGPRAVPHPSGLIADCIVIEADGEDQWTDDLTPIPNYTAFNPVEVRNYVAQAGIVGLGGAGFPTHLKLKTQGIRTLILNGAECEPYITCDDRLMREFPEEVVQGAQIIRYILGSVPHCIIAIEDNKPIAYQAISQAARGLDIQVIKVPTHYPMGGERQLIKVLTGEEIRQTLIPSQRGIVVHNVNTARSVYRAAQFGEPLISRIVTVTGSGIEHPQNLETRLGTSMHSLIEHCGRKPNIERLIIGGSMMGIALPTDEVPIVKTTNCLLVSTLEDFPELPIPMPCIRCGDCASVCPMNLLPQQLYWYARAKDFKKTEEYHLFDCIECGCCAYSCPSHIPLVGYYRYAKAEIRTADHERKKAEIAKRRHEFKTARLEKTNRRKPKQANEL